MVDRLDNLHVNYAGIGSRETPDKVLDTMYTIAQRLALRGMILRSGGADGADSAFEAGATALNAAMEIYLPWDGFNDRFVSSAPHRYQLVNPADHLVEASKAHPIWDRLKPSIQRLHARNVPQVLGSQPYTFKSRFVICWAKPQGFDPAGKQLVQGGTGQAVRLAHMHNIPVFNLFNEGALEDIAAFLEANNL